MAIGVGGGDLFDGNADAERCWELEKEIKKLKQQLAEKDARDLTIARLRWENRYLLNRSSVKALVVGDYGKLAPFKDEIVSADEKEKMEDFEREAYIDLGGDVSEWWLYEFKSYLGPYGFQWMKIDKGVYGFYEMKTDGTRLIATIDVNNLVGKFWLKCEIESKRKYNNPCILNFSKDNFLKVREYIFNWAKND